MKAPLTGRLVLVLLVFSISGSPANGWGVRQTHQRLAERALELANSAGRIDRFLREEYGLTSGMASELAVIVGLDGNEGVDGEMARFAIVLGGIWHGDPAPGDSYLLASAPSEEDPLRFSIEHLIRAGVFAEDNPNIRSRHHFHDPIRTHALGSRGLDDSEGFPGSEFVAEVGTIVLPGHGSQYPFGENFDGTGLSARDRALGVSSDGGESPSAATPPNVFALPDAERYLYRALTGRSEAEREGSLAYHFIAFGHVLHLLQDMTSPGHVRNDFWMEHVLPEFHVVIPMLGWRIGFGAGIEEIGESLNALTLIRELQRSGLDWPSRPREFIAATNATYGTSYPVGIFAPSVPGFNAEGRDAARFWASEGVSTDLALLGLAERVAPEYFTRGSISNVAPDGYPSPAVPGECNARLPLRGLDGKAEIGFFTGVPLSGLYLSSPLVPHLARCRFHGGAQVNYGSEPELRFSVIDSAVQRDYMEHLFALALDYTEKFISFYFSPRLEVVPIGPRQFRLRNRSLLEFRADASTVEIAYDVSAEAAAQGSRAVVPADCGEGEIVLPPAPAPGTSGPASATVCEMPASVEEPPGDVTGFLVVARGKLGERGQVATREDLAGEQTDFVVAFDRVLPRLLLFLHDGPFPGSDAELRNDVWSLDIDLAKALPEGEYNEISSLDPLTNVTAPLRGSGGSPLLDFVHPAGKPGSSLIALRSDRDATRVSDNFFDVAAPLGVYLFDPLQEPPSLVAIPAGELEHASEHHFLPRWSVDGEALFFRAPKHVRYLVASGMTRGFDDDEAFSTSNVDPPEALEIGDERDVCFGVDFLSALNTTRVLVDTTCRREHVSKKEEMLGGGFRIEWSPVIPAKREVRIAEVEQSPRQSEFLHARLTHRVDVASGSIIPCGGLPDSCSERSAEPNGEEGAEELSPVWSPDGSRFAFLRDPTAGDQGAVDSGGEELWITDLSGGTVRRVLTRDHGDLFRLAWHPSGDRLLLGVGTAEQADIVTVDPDGPDDQVPGRLARFANIGAARFSLYAPLVLPYPSP